MNGQNAEAENIKTSDLKPGNFIPQTLSDEFIERVKNFKQLLDEVESSSIDITLENFKMDLNPHEELLIWEHIAKIYSQFVSANPELSLKQKKNVFGILLRLSAGAVDISHTETLSRDMVEEIAGLYQKDMNNVPIGASDPNLGHEDMPLHYYALIFGLIIACLIYIFFVAYPKSVSKMNPNEIKMNMAL